MPNPFFNYGTVETFPGALRTRPTVSRADLLKPYPQYLNMFQDWTNGRKARYHTLELRAQRPFSCRACRCSAGYAYVRGTRQEFYDNVDEYDARVDVDRRARSAAPAEPVGRLGRAGRPRAAIGSDMNPALDAIVGNWEVAGIYRYESGQYLRFGGMVAPAATPKTVGEVGAGNFWFDTTGFRTLPAFTRRANPWQYDDLKGPNYNNVDLALVKRVPLKGRCEAELPARGLQPAQRHELGEPESTRSAPPTSVRCCGRPTRTSAGSCSTRCEWSSR